MYTPQDQRSLTRFHVVLAHEDMAEAIVLHSARNADQATIAFHLERLRLIQDRVWGELLLVRHDAETATLLREPLHPESVPRGPVRRHQARVVTVLTRARDDNRRI